MNDPVEWGRSIAKAFKEHLAEALVPIEARLKALESIEPVEATIEEAEPVDVDDLVVGAVARMFKDGSVDKMLQDFGMVDRLVDGAVAKIPRPVDGKDGESIDPEDVERMVGEAVAKAVSEIPVPKDGKDGIDGKDGVDGKDGESVTAEDVLKALEPEIARWELDFERRAQELFQRAIENMPKPKDGRDALELEDFDVSVGDDGRTVTMSLKRGDEVIERSIRFDVPIYRGVFSDGQTYQKNDGVTWGGCMWFANETTTDKPGTDAWRLAVKKGRDAK